MRRRIRPPCRAQFNTLQFPPITCGRQPDATRSLSVKVSSLTGASSLLEGVCMDVPRETVDVQPAYARDLFPPLFPRAVPSWDLHLRELLGTPCRVWPCSSPLDQLSQWARGGTTTVMCTYLGMKKVSTNYINTLHHGGKSSLPVSPQVVSRDLW
jgi:hypothetical protein